MSKKIRKELKKFRKELDAKNSDIWFTRIVQSVFLLGRKIIFKGVKLFLILIIFLFALELIRETTRILVETQALGIIQQSLDSPPKALSASLLSAGIMMSGSPVAALGIVLTANQIILQDTLLYIILGSRIAPNTILFLAGIMALLTKKSLKRSFSVAIMEFTTNLFILLGALLVAPLFFDVASNGGFTETLVKFNASSFTVLNKLFDPIVYYFFHDPTLSVVIPGFIIGLLLLFIALKLFDRMLSFLEVDEVRLEEQTMQEYILNWRHPWQAFKSTPRVIRRYSRQLYDDLRYLLRKDKPEYRWITLLQNPYFAFIAGFGITLLTFSLTVSVSLMLPLYLYGRIGPKTMVPFILGANISTYADTLFVAILSGSPEATSTVVTIIYSVGLVVLISLLLIKLLTALITVTTKWISMNKWILITVILAIWLVPTLVLFVF